jgi:hypothetical protein
MLCRVEVLGRVPVFRIIAAADMAAEPAQTQMNPRVAHGEAFFASVGIRIARKYGVQMAATR